MSLTKYITHYVTPPPTLTEEGVKELLSEALKKVQIYRIPKDNTIYVTEAVQPCIRLAYFNRLYPQPPSVATLLGEYLHQVIEQELRRLGFQTEVGLSLDLNEFRLVGRADVLIENEDGNVEYVAEIKTTNKLPPEPYKTHTLQLQTYMTILKAQKGVLVYIDRNKGRVRIFDVRPNPSALQFTISNAKALWEALNNHTPPSPHRGAWCVFCPHRKRCKLVSWESRRVMA